MFDGTNWICTSSVSGKWVDVSDSGDIYYTGGNVGIGTTSPDEALHVEGSLLVDAYNTSDPSSSGIFFREGLTGEYPADDPQPYNASITLWDGSNNGASYDGLSINGYDGVVVRTGSNEVPSLVVPSSGNVGIGTTSPSATLDVRSGEKTGTNTLARFSTAEDANQQLLYIQNIENTGMLIQATESSVSNNNLLLNRYGGNVGIATLSPDARLDVEGSLQADTFTGEAKIYTHAQEITTNSAVDVEHFAMYIGQGVYSTIALVNQGDGTDGAGTVDTYQFDYSGSGLTVGNFQPKQTLTGFTNPNDVEVFQEYEYDEEGNIVTATETYLIVGDASDAATLHQWNGSNFVAITGKEIPTTGHTDTEVFYIDGQQVIALAQSGEIDIRTWDGSEYSIKDPIKLDGVQKLHFFEADLNADDATEGYLAAATASGLTIYQWQEGQGYYVFSEFATLDAPNAQNAHFFGINKDSETGKYERQFLMVPSDGNVDSPLYEWNGTEFEVTQTLDTYSGSVAATNFEFEGTEYLVLTAKGNSDSNYDYIRFFYYEDDIFKIRQSLSSKNIATGVNGLMDIETWFFGGEHRLMLAEATPSRVLRIEEYNNVIIGIDNIGQSEEHNLYVPGGDILMSMYDHAPTDIDGISYDDTDNVYSFHADQEHRPGWDSPGAAISAKNGYFGGRYVGSANTSGNYYLGNFDWTDYVGNHSNYNYSEEHQGVIISNSMNVFFGNRTPIDPEATYRIRVRAKKLSGDGTFYAGVQTLDEHFVELRTDGAKTYNYGVASAQVINVGETKTFEGFFKGYGVVDAADHNKFDPGGKYFNAMIIANYHTTDSESETVIESIEIEKVDTIIADKDGNVGIGTSSPNAHLEIDSKGGAPSETFSTTASNASLSLASSDGTTGIGTGTRLLGGIGGSEYAWFQAQNSISETGNNAEDISLNPVGGNVGIGTTSPDKSLHVRGSNGYSQMIVESTAPSGSGGDAGIQLQGSGATNRPVLIGKPNGTFQINKWINNSTWGATLMTILTNGNVGIGASSPSYKLHVGGTAYATGAAGSLSDSRHKNTITDLGYGLAEILKLRPVSFLWNTDKVADSGMEGTQLGFIAQEVEEIIPEVIMTQDDEANTKAMKHSSLISPLVQAVKELHALYQGHADRIAVLEAQNQQLLETIADLQEKNTEQDNHIAHQDERIAHQDELIVQLEVRLAALEAAQ